MAEQQQAGAVVSTRNAATTQQRVQRQVVQKQARVSTRSVAPKKPVAVAGKRYVQVGTYGVAANAQRAAQRLQQMGLPVRIGKFSRGGKQMRIVLAGPFKSAAHTGGALSALRNAGYHDAFARN
ncbi:MAG: SPOR domain-containing protein, partial [Pseudomonadota bacterium]